MDYVALDLETTGLEPRLDRIVEIGAVRFDCDGRVLATFETLVDPGRTLPSVSRAFHGLNDADLASAPATVDVLPQFQEFLGRPGDVSLLAHNACMDAGFLGAELRRAGRESPSAYLIDTLTLARLRLPGLKSHRLEALGASLGLGCAPTHRALADALCVKDLWLRLGGHEAAPEMLVAYPVHDPGLGLPPPRGWDGLERAIALGKDVRIVHDGRRRGLGPRLVTPRRFSQQGGEPFLVAFCHISRREKAFRLDRIREYEPVP